MLCEDCKIKKAINNRITCDNCFNSRRRKTYKRSLERNPFEVRCRKLKASCKKRGINFNLDAEYLASIWTGICPIFNLELVLVREDIKHKSINCADLDRFKPELGYVKGNVSWVSTKANRMKSDGSIEEIEKLLIWMKGWKEPERKTNIEEIVVDGVKLSDRKKIPRPEVFNKGKKMGRNLKMEAEKNPNAKLTIEQAKEIRQKYNGERGQIQRLSEEYKVAPSNIKKIIDNKSYKEN
jgi:hypothetical protein